MEMNLGLLIFKNSSGMIPLNACKKPSESFANIETFPLHQI